MAAITPQQREAIITETIARIQQELNLEAAGAGGQNAARSERLADVKQLQPTAAAWVTMPPCVLAKLPADLGQLQEGKACIPLLPLQRVNNSSRDEGSSSGAGAGRP